MTRSDKGDAIQGWVTKYALTQGIIRADGYVDRVYRSMFCYGRTTAHGNDWHRSEAAAIARAEEMRKAKCSSLRKQLEAMEGLVFMPAGETK